jgi:starch synthase
MLCFWRIKADGWRSLCYNSPTMKAKKIALLASEVAPFAKTGGLADVAGALPKFLSRLGVEVNVFMPFYREIKRKNLALRQAGENVELDWDGKKNHFSVLEHKEGQVTFFFIEKDDYFDRDYLYGTPQGDYPDNGERFAFFSRAALESLKFLNSRPDVIHGHDWQSAAALAYLKFVYPNDPFFAGTRSLFTIHNLAYQGLFEKGILIRVGLPGFLFNMEDLEFYGKVNYLKAGILYSTAVNTVSPRYSQEIQTPEFGHRLDGLLRKRSDALCGILNGVDYADWDPATDKFISTKFGAARPEGKDECKKDLLKSFSLPGARNDVPVVGMVSRLAGQKGFDILSEALGGLFKLGVDLVILGTGEEVFQKSLRSAQKKYPRSFGLSIAFDEALSHKIYAGSDIFLIPSRYEPCGLTQMYSLRYGTVPVVRATGGLDDTIEEYDPGKNTGNGFKFQEYTASALLSSLHRAVSVYRRKEEWRGLIQKAMSCDFSWDRSAREYLRLYDKISAR